MCIKILKVVSKTLVQNEKISKTIFSFGNALVTVLDGTGKFTVGRKEFILSEGKSIIMPKDIPHAVFVEEKFKMLLTLSF